MNNDKAIRILVQFATPDNTSSNKLDNNDNVAALTRKE